MKKMPLFLLILLLLSLLWQCKNVLNPPGDFPAKNDITVTWEMLANGRADRPVCDAEFVIYNHGRRELGNSGWAMYFSQFPREIVPGSVSPEVTIEWINGDFFRITPADLFLLEPGDSMIVSYTYLFRLLKRCSHPADIGYHFPMRNGSMK
jgi:hexosaminidase